MGSGCGNDPGMGHRTVCEATSTDRSASYYPPTRRDGPRGAHLRQSDRPATSSWLPPVVTAMAPDGPIGIPPRLLVVIDRLVRPSSGNVMKRSPHLPLGPGDVPLVATGSDSIVNRSLRKHLIHSDTLSSPIAALCIRRVRSGPERHHTG